GNIFGVNTFTGVITVGSSAGASIGSGGGGILTLSNTINGNGPLTFTGAGNFNLTGSIQNGSAGIIKVGAGTLTLNGSTNLSTGVGTISAGTVKLAANERIADPSALNFTASTATFDMAGFNETVGSLSGSGQIVNDNGNLTVGGDGTPTTFSGSIGGS